MSQALNKTGRNISFMCNFPWSFWGMDTDPADGGVWVSEFCNSWRVAGDPQPGFENALGYVASVEKYADAVPSKPGAWATLDAIEIGNSGSFDVLYDGAAEGGQRQALRVGGGAMTPAQEIAAISLYMLVKTPIFIGADVTKLEGHSLEAFLNKDLISIHQDPLGAQGRRLRADGDTEVWGCALSGSRHAAVLLNKGGAAVSINVTWAELDRLSGGTPPECSSQSSVAAADSRAVFDVWEHKTLGSFDGGFEAGSVDAMSVVVVVVSPAPRGRAQQLGSWATADFA